MRGMVLIATMLGVLMVVMILGAAVRLVPSVTAMASDTRARALALEAAEVGVTVAQARLQGSGGSSWRGDGNALTVQAPNASLTVLEDKGNVIGLLHTPDGTVSEFLIRFNPQDGSNDPSAAHWIRNPYLSVNNLSNVGITPVPLGNGPNYSQTSDSHFVCPANTACLLVEGRAGEGLREATVDQPYPPAGQRQVVSRLVECHLQANGNSFLPSALYAGNGLYATDQTPYDSKKGVGGFALSAVQKTDVPRLLINGNVAVQDGSSNPDQVVTDKAISANGILSSNGSYSVSGLTHTTYVPVAGTPAFPALDWNQVQQADPSSAPQLKAGTYMWRPTGNGGAKELYYYNQDFEQLGTGWTLPAANPADLVSSLGSTLGTANAGSTPAFQAKNGGQIQFNDNIYVTSGGSGGASTLALVSYSNDRGNFGSGEGKGQSLVFNSSKNTNLFLTNQQGGIFLEGQIDGSKGASITSAGNINLAGGGSKLNYYGQAQTVSVNLYAKKQIVLKTQSYDGTTRKYNPLSLHGLMYSWGNITIDGGNQKVDITGAVVAYGCNANPAISVPGSSNDLNIGNGTITCIGDQSRITYDSSVLQGVRSGGGAQPLRRAFWYSY